MTRSQLDKARYPERVVLANQYHQMLARCYRTGTVNYSNYGGRGILVCDEWRDSWQAFKSWAKQSGWKLGLWLDRIDNEKGYFPENCRWITSTESGQNRRSVKLNYQIVQEIFDLISEGKLSQTAIARRCGTDQSTVSRIKHAKRWQQRKKAG